VAAPREVFGWMAESWSAQGPVRVLLVAGTMDPVATRDGTRILPDAMFDDVAAVDLMWVPGGGVDGLQAMMRDGGFLAQLNGWAAGARWVTSVCEGALLLAQAGLLDGYRATTHWAFLPCLASYPAIEAVGGDGCFPRFVVDPGPDGGAAGGVRVTGAGISSGIDEALELVKLIAGESVAESVQQTIQYFPDPPVSAPAPVPGDCPLANA
jgi:cyclohexyl-isocyanide hydratase